VRAGEQAQITAPVNAAETQNLSYVQRTSGGPPLHEVPSPAVGIRGNMRRKTLVPSNMASAGKGKVVGGSGQGAMDAAGDAAGSIGGTELERQDRWSQRQPPEINGQDRIAGPQARSGGGVAGSGGGGRSGSVGGERAGSREVRGSVEEGRDGELVHASGGGGRAGAAAGHTGTKSEGASAVEGAGTSSEGASWGPAALGGAGAGGRGGGGGEGAGAVAGAVGGRGGGGGGVTRRYSPADLPVAVVAFNRPAYLHRSLTALLQARGAVREMVTVCQDGRDAGVAAVARQLNVRLVQHERGAGAAEAAVRIAAHYKAVLSPQRAIFIDNLLVRVHLIIGMTLVDRPLRHGSLNSLFRVALLSPHPTPSTLDLKLQALDPRP